MTRRQRRGYTGFFAFLLAGATAFACSSGDKNGGTSTGAKCTTSQDCAGVPCVSGVCQIDGGSGASTSGDGSMSNGGLSSGGSSSGGSSSGGLSSGGSSTGGSSSTGAPAGSHCTQGSDCESGTCTGGLCMPPPGTLPNTTCSTGPDCASGICTSGICEIPAGASGTVDQTDCPAGALGCMCQPDGKCQKGLTCVDGQCCNSLTGSCTPGTSLMDAGAGSGGMPSACTPGVVGPVITECGYPYASANPLTDILFNESTVLAALVPSGGYPFASLKVFYNDEHAMTLGVREVIINGVSTTYPVSPLTMSPDVVNNPQTGTNLIIGQQAGVDPVGRPMWPALFITDITNDPNAVSGDWQWGGTAINPTYIAGTWKGAVRTVDSTGASITPDADPAPNGQDYGNGDVAPAGSIVKAEAYGTEVRWDIRLEAGHNYRFQVMVHDGDQNKVGGDSGEACVTFCAGNACPEGLSSCTTDTDCTNGDVCTGGCCVPPTTSTPPAPDGGTCPPDWQTYVASEGASSICTPPPIGGVCPSGYVITIQNNQQYCTPVFIR